MVGMEVKSCSRRKDASADAVKGGDREIRTMIKCDSLPALRFLF